MEGLVCGERGVVKGNVVDTPQTQRQTSPDQEAEPSPRPRGRRPPGSRGRHTPPDPEVDTPSGPQADTLDPEAHPADPEANTPPDPEADSLVETPSETGGTHPTRMHSCLQLTFSTHKPQ